MASVKRFGGEFRKPERGPRVVSMSAEDAKRFFGFDDEPTDLGPTGFPEKYKPGARVFEFDRGGTPVLRERPSLVLGDRTITLRRSEHRLVQRALKSGGCIHVRGVEVRAARRLAEEGAASLRDDGAFGPTHSSNIDGERWTFTLNDGVTLRGES